MNQEKLGDHELRLTYEVEGCDELRLTSSAPSIEGHHITPNLLTLAPPSSMRDQPPSVGGWPGAAPSSGSRSALV